MADSKRICSVDDCDNPVMARGWCRKHYARWRAHGDPTVGPAKFPRHCSVGGCDYCGKTIRGLCPKHYCTLRRNGSPTETVRFRKGAAMEWLQQNKDHDGLECLTWPFSRAKDGYGRVHFNGTQSTASRVMCILAHGEPPTQRHQSAHSCGRGDEGCVNPLHLRWATPQENQIERVDHGTSNRGENHGASVLTEDIVRKIKARSGERPILIAEELGISYTNVYHVLNGASWSWVEQYDDCDESRKGRSVCRYGASKFPTGG